MLDDSSLCAHLASLSREWPTPESCRSWESLPSPFWLDVNGEIWWRGACLVLEDNPRNRPLTFAQPARRLAESCPGVTKRRCVTSLPKSPSGSSPATCGAAAGSSGMAHKGHDDPGLLDEPVPGVAVMGSQWTIWPDFRGPTALLLTRPQAAQEAPSSAQHGDRARRRFGRAAAQSH